MAPTALAWLALAVPRLTARAVRLFPEAIPPANHPNQARTLVHPPSSLGPAFGGEPAHFCGYRGGITASGFDAYNSSGLGDVVWPQYPVMYAADQWIGLMEERPWLWLADISNYVPGDNGVCDPAPPSSVCEYHAPRETIDLLVAKLGDRFTGMDNGEQDGRYISYTNQLLRGAGADVGVAALGAGGAGGARRRGGARRKAFLNFRRHFERMEGDLGNRLMSLNSLWYPHYFAGAGYYTMLGAETAQGLPNDQIFYAFLRGAAKQYGLLIWGDASIGNRWWGPEGPKTCAADPTNSTACRCSTMGTSVSLLRRLMYNQLMYGSAFMSFEGSLSCTGPGGGAPRTSPIGQVQQAGMAWSQGLGKGGLGVHLATVAVLLDYFTGFTPPRHLYSDDVYRVWGTLPWEHADFWVHGVLDQLYPGYERSSFFHNESGFLTGTPYTDMADVLLTDAPGWLLQQYAVVVLGSPLRAQRAELVDKLVQYVEAGGTLVLAGTALAGDGPVVFGMQLDLANRTGRCVVVPQRATVAVAQIGAPGAPAKPVREGVPVVVCPLVAPPDAVPVATVARLAAPLAVRLARGNGTVLALASTGVAATAQVPLPIPAGASQVDRPLENPFPMASHAAALLDQVLAAQTPFSAGPAMAGADGLGVVATRVSRGRYFVGVSNHGLAQQPLALSTRLGSIVSATEVRLADAWINAGNTDGYAATHTPNGTDLGKSTATTIAGLDARLFEVVVNETATELIGQTGAAPPPRSLDGPIGVGLPLPPTRRVQEQLLLRPGFTQRFDTVVVDWRHVERTEAAALADEGRWLFRQNIRTVVDLSSGINLYPDLRLINNSAAEYAQSLDRVMAVLRKAGTLLNASSASAATATYSADVVWSLHRAPENDYDWPACLQDFKTTALAMAAQAARLGITLHLRVGTDGKAPSTLANALVILKNWGDPPNVKLAVSTAMLIGNGVPLGLLNATASRIGLWMAGFPLYDPFGSSSGAKQLLSNHGSLGSASPAAGASAWIWQAGAVLFKWIRRRPAGTRTAAVVLDASLQGYDGTDLDALDEEYAERKALASLLAA